MRKKGVCIISGGNGIGGVGGGKRMGRRFEGVLDLFIRQLPISNLIGPGGTRKERKGSLRRRFKEKGLG